MKREQGPALDHRRRKAGRTVAAAALAPAVLAAVLGWWEPFAARALRDLVFDGYQRLSPRPYDPKAPVRVIAIDDESLQRIGQWPWPRARIAELIERLAEADAAAVAVDILFAEPERPTPGAPSGDDALARALAKSRVVLGAALGPGEAKPAVKAIAWAGDDPRLFAPAFDGAVVPLEGLQAESHGLGAMNFIPDRDLVVREIHTVFTAAGVLVPSLDLEALRVAQDVPTTLVRASHASGEHAFGRRSGIVDLKVGAVQTRTSRDGAVRIRFSGSHRERRIPAWRVLAGDFDRSRIDGAIALVGVTALALDLRATPLEADVPGVDIHAEMIETLMAGAQLTRPDFLAGLELVMVIVGATFAFSAASRLPPLSAGLVTVFLVLLFVACSAVAFRELQQLLNPLWPSIGSLATLGVATIGVLRQTERERRQVREAFSRYVSPAIVEALARDPSRLTLGGQTRTLTVLFSDIRGFTARSETMPAEEVVRFLNDIHAPMAEHVLATGGTLDKFIGDGMMAFWNAPLEHPDHVRAALRCALSMQRTVEEMNRGSSRPGASTLPPLGLGVAIHTGPACVGNIGSSRRFDYSAVGDTVNMAARMEPLCKTYGVQVVVSADVVERAPEFPFLLIDVVRLRGRKTPSRVYALQGDEAALTEAFRTFRDLHDEAILLALEHRAEAREALRACAENPLAGGCRKLYEFLEARAAAHEREVTMGE